MLLALTLAPLAHLVGDYPLQSHTMATRKSSSWRWALIHAAFYALPFLAVLVTLAPAARVLPALLVIAGTHAVIDRLGIAGMWCRWYGVGHPGLWWTDADRAAHREIDAQRIYEEWCKQPSADRDLLPAWEPDGRSAMQERARREASDFPYPAPFLGVWLTIIVDNTMHLCLNAAALALACWGIDVG